ncbi:MAG: SRPBCC family protein, partial [Rhodospirillaceae bacterium]|nr:SRPBCC family protein [Rhodospirillaceae bacterium]
MPTVTKEAVFAAAADDVWAIVREFGRLDDWLPPVVVCRT